jgi:hypothetical protein
MIAMTAVAIRHMLIMLLMSASRLAQAELSQTPKTIAKCAQVPHPMRIVTLLLVWLCVLLGMLQMQTMIVKSVPMLLPMQIM